MEHQKSSHKRHTKRGAASMGSRAGIARAVFLSIVFRIAFLSIVFRILFLSIVFRIVFLSIVFPWQISPVANSAESDFRYTNLVDIPEPDFRYTFFFCIC